MITIDSKVGLFQKIVYEKIELEYKQLLEEVEVANEIALTNHQKAASEKAEHFVDTMVKDAELEKKRTIAKVKGEVKSRILNTRAHLLDDLVKAVEMKARNFVTTEDYKICLLKRFESNFEAYRELDDLLIEMVDKDIPRFKDDLTELVSSLGFEGGVSFVETDEPIIGGVVVYNLERTIKYDSSIQAIISENYNLMGQMVHKMLKEAGEASE